MDCASSGISGRAGLEPGDGAAARGESARLSGRVQHPEAAPREARPVALYRIYRATAQHGGLPVLLAEVLEDLALPRGIARHSALPMKAEPFAEPNPDQDLAGASDAPGIPMALLIPPWRTELRAKATIDLARAARLVLRATVFVGIAFKGWNAVIDTNLKRHLVHDAGRGAALARCRASRMHRQHRGRGRARDAGGRAYLRRARRRYLPEQDARGRVGAARHPGQQRGARRHRHRGHERLSGGAPGKALGLQRCAHDAARYSWCSRAKSRWSSVRPLARSGSRKRRATPRTCAGSRAASNAT